MTRNRSDATGYLSTPRDECLGVLSGLMGGFIVIAGALLGRVI